MTLIVILVVIVLLVIWGISIYNNLVKLRNNRENAFANIDVQLKQRHDLIPPRKGTVGASHSGPCSSHERHWHQRQDPG